MVMRWDISLGSSRYEFLIPESQLKYGKGEGKSAAEKGLKIPQT